VTEQEAIALAKSAAGDVDHLLPTAFVVEPSCSDEFLVKRNLGHWIVGFRDSASHYVVNHSTGEVQLVLSLFAD
jgi:hypothetical protein